MKTIFWVSALVVAWVYVGYPALLLAWSRAARRMPHPADTGRELPSVSVLLAVRNEASRLPERLQNLFALDYPGDRLEIIAVSNGSSDATPAVLDRFRDRVRVSVLGAVGKAAALNHAAAAARGELLVFADARQRFAPDALRRLVEPFDDPVIGAVSGELVLDSESVGGAPAAASRSQGGPEAASGVGEGVGLYWRYEKWLRRNESRIHSLLGATGAIYAMRRDLWRPLPPDTILDDVLTPMRVVMAGYRTVFTPAAKAFDQASPDAATETRRKIRTLAGNYQLLWIEPRLLLPLVNPVWLQFVSHKVGRLAVPYALVGLLVSGAVLASAGPVYGLALTAQVVFYVLAMHGALLAGASRDAGARPAAAMPRPRRVEVDERRDTRVHGKEWLNAHVD
jgi:poly-beta-1,6-N-acetyl-D-glucosamine synthase